VASFLAGAGPAVIGAIAGSAISLGLDFTQTWQIPILGGALVWLLALRRGVVVALLAGALIGVMTALGGVPT
jgi:chromate transporter